MKDLRTLFIRWYFNQFVDQDTLHVGMSAVFEDSPWHREINVAVHTNMVVGEYLAQATNTEWSYYDLYGAFVAAFHDVGKPAARTEAYKPKRGTYYRYGGHELISARLWEDWAVTNWKFLQSEFNLSTTAIYRVGWLIENHLPWDIKKAEKRRVLATGAMYCAGSVKVFNNIVKADTLGRISDDATEKRAKVNAWCDEFTKIALTVKVDLQGEQVDLDKPIMYVPVGVSGSGKSTLFTSDSMDCVRTADGTMDDDITYFSMDAFRLAWYDKDDYANAYKLAAADKKFSSRVDKAYQIALDMQDTIYLDNMNIARKSRAKYITKARQKGYHIYAIVMPVALQTVIGRQKTRTDKTLPESLIRDMYMKLSLPAVGEVDRIITYSGNLPTV